MKSNRSVKGPAEPKRIMARCIDLIFNTFNHPMEFNGLVLDTTVLWYKSATNEAWKLQLCQCNFTAFFHRNSISRVVMMLTLSSLATPEVVDNLWQENPGFSVDQIMSFGAYVIVSDYHIETWIKWWTFCKLHIQMRFLQWFFSVAPFENK